MIEHKATAEHNYIDIKEGRPNDRHLLRLSTGGRESHLQIDIKCLIGLLSGRYEKYGTLDASAFLSEQEVEDLILVLSYWKNYKRIPTEDDVIAVKKNVMAFREMVKRGEQSSG